MVKSNLWLTAAVVGAAACTNYVDAILPRTTADGGTKVDVGTKMDVDSAEKPLISLDSRFGQDGTFSLAVSANDEVADAFIGPNGTTYVLLKESCTLVAVTGNGVLDATFGKGGVLRAEPTCVAQRLTLDRQNKRILVITKGSPNSIMFAHNLDGSPSVTLADGDKVKIDFSNVSSVLPTRNGFLIAGMGTNMAGVVVGAFDVKGIMLNRETVSLADASSKAYVYSVDDGTTFVLNGTRSADGLPIMDLAITSATEFAKLGSTMTFNPLGITGSALASLTTATRGFGDQPLVLGEGWRKDAPMDQLPMIWAPTDMKFGDRGVTTLPHGMTTVYVDLAFGPGLTAVVGSDGIMGEQRPALTLLDGQGNLDPHVAKTGFFTLPFADPSAAAKVLFANDGAILVLGNIGFQGKASLFISRLVLN
ncbi:MAG: hypothetical protein SF187_08840 [Deltaproteobacteria bacterium]|nr:hypothetical protein [Deltaproteobacteria bacterium]